MLKLFTVQENDSLKQSQNARDIARIEMVRETLIKEQKNLDNLKAGFDLTMAEQRKYAAVEEEKFLRKIESLNKEVKILEERQRVAHFPIDPAERKAYDNLQRSRKILEDSELQKSKNEDLEEALQDKIDSLSERELELDKRDQKTKIGESNLDYQRLQIKALTEDLSKKWSEFYSVSTEKDREITEKNRIIHLHREDLDKREDELLEHKIRLKDDQERLQSDRETLKAAFQEINKKNNKQNG